MGARRAAAALLGLLVLLPAAGGAEPPQRRTRDGLSASSWRLRPGTLVTPERRVFRILVTERSCASGRPATGRIDEPLVIRERHRVQVAIFVRPLEGPSTCPSNPETPYTLRLDRPLGHRTPADGGTIPPRRVHGRLSRAAYQRRIDAIVADTAGATALYDHLAGRRSVRRCAQLMWSFTGEVGRLLERVAALDPPLVAAKIQRDFLAAAWRSWHRLERIAGRVAQGSVRCGAELNERIYGRPSTKRAERAIARLERRGYRVFGE
jgi:hypothetical protein